MSVRTHIAALCGGLLLAACAGLPSNVEDMARPEKQRVLHGELVRDMLGKGHNYAALAHLQELERQQGDLNEDQLLLRAEAYYRLGETGSARQDYLQLTRTKKAGQAWHGLGRLDAPQDLRAAIQSFNRATELRPTDAAIRNDLGYTLLLAGRVEDACRHLYTAHELAPTQDRIVGNLLLCEALRGDTGAEERLLQVHGFTPAERVRHAQHVDEVLTEIQRRRHELQDAEPENADESR